MKHLTDTAKYSSLGRILPQLASWCVRNGDADTRAGKLRKSSRQSGMLRNLLNRLSQNALRFSALPVALFAFCAPAQAVDQNSISALNVSTGNGVTVIKVQMTQPLAKLPASFTINTPPRIVFDFPNTANGLGKSVQDFNQGNLHSANIVQAGNRTRLVVNLDQMLTYDSKLDGKNLLLTLHNKSADTVTSRTSRFAEAKEGAQKHELRDIDFRRGQNGEGRIEVDLSDPGIGIDIRQQGTNLIVDFLKTSLPVSATWAG
jgi:type IV pilus assembly protein PilQ